jgi:hypothetical protein
VRCLSFDNEEARHFLAVETSGAGIAVEPASWRKEQNMGFRSLLESGSCHGKLTGAVISAVEALERRQLFSNTWFVSAGGSNANAGTITAPFQTIQQAASIAQPGDTVMIRGGIYHETVTPANSGTTSAPIIYEAYNNESVTIDGADPITGWSPNPVYQAKMGWDLGEGNNQVFVNGIEQVEARWPNTSLDASHPTGSTAQSSTTNGSSTTIYDSALTQGNGFWVGAVIHFTPGQHWVAYTATVTASGPGYVTFNYTAQSSDVAVSAGTTYYIVGKFSALDSPGEWYYDSTSGTLSLWPSTGDNAANDLVEAKHRLYGFNLAGVSNITVEGINLFACTINTDTNSSNITLNHINAQYVSQFLSQPDGWSQPYACGILLAGNGDLLENSEIAYSCGDGVFVSGAYDRVTNCIIHDVDTNGGDGAGIRNYGWYNSLDHNTIYNCGRNGINVFGEYVQVTYNTISNCLIQTTDGGGIYTMGSNGTGSLIGYNRISNVLSGGYGGVGVYLDNNSSNWTVARNITSNVNYALKANGSSLNEQIYNNTFDSTQYSLAAQGGYMNWTGSAVENNIFVQPFFGSELGVTFASNIYNGTNANLNTDYTLQVGSPAIDAGHWIAPYTNTYNGSAPDIGALEYGLTAFASGAAINWLPVAPVFKYSAPASPPPPPPPTVPVTGTLATSVINGLSYTAAQGVAPSFGALGYLDGGDWVEYGQVNFQSGVSQVTLDLAVTAAYAGQQIQLRIDSLNGPVIGTLTTKATTAWNDFEAQSTAVTDVTGIHDLYLLGVGWYGIANYSWLTFTPASTTSPSATAVYLNTDLSTGGNWTGTYGADGYSVFGGTAAIPTYASLGVSGNQYWQWETPGTSDTRALQTSAGSSIHEAACDYSSGSFTFDLNLTDGQTHQVALYLLDSDYRGRSETIQITDAASGAVLSTTDVKNFANGAYQVYDLSGHVKITISNDAGSLNAVASGIFFG